MKSLRIGAGAGYSGDRIEPAVELAEKGQLEYLVFECLAERTIALAQQRMAIDPHQGYDPLLEARMRACLPICHRKHIKILTNMGAANPLAAAEQTAEVARALGLKGVKIAAITGDDVLDQLWDKDLSLIESGKPLSSIRDQMISANAYLGCQSLVEALQQGADVVITGRVADPALFLAPLMHHFGWSFADADRLGKGTLLGHLLECAAQVSGGYFADPGHKEVPNLSRLGFPIAEVQEDGRFFLTKVAGSGGCITPATCKEQLLYEIHDPAHYATPDVIADFMGVSFRELAPDKIQVRGGTGRPKSGLLKVSVGYQDHFIGEGQISYGGAGAVERAKLALEIIRDRLAFTHLNALETRFDLIGMNALYGQTLPPGQPNEVRVRVAARTRSLSEAIKIGNEVEALYTNGPAGGGGVSKTAQEVIGIQSVLIPEEWVNPHIHLQQS